MLDIFDRSHILKELLEQGKIGMIGAMYDVNTGRVHFSEYAEQIQAFDAKHSKDLLATFNHW
jgi:carbonic anhydrase